MPRARYAPGPLSSLALALAAPLAWADPPIHVVERGTTRLTHDGLVTDWQGLTELLAVDSSANVLAGAGAWTGADDASLGFALARDDEGLWVAAEVRDDRIVRTARHRDLDDTLVLSLAVTVNNRPVAYDLAIQPGEPGAFAGAVRYRGPRTGPVPGATVVEAPLRGASGYTLEARIPWRAVPELRANLATLRGRVAYCDADLESRPAVDTLLATGPGDARRPGELPPAAGTVGTSGPGNLLQVFALQHGLGNTPPVLDRGANLAGDAAQERVVVFPQHLVAFGPGVQGGQNYVYAALPARAAADVLDAGLVDVTGDARPEVVLRLRVASAGFTRDVMMVYGIDGAGLLQRYFVHEVGRAQGERRVDTRVGYLPGARIRLTVGPVRGFTAATYPAATEPGVEPPLVPWGPRREAVYQWNPTAGAFSLERAVANPAASAPPSPAPPAPAAPPPAAADVPGVLRAFRQRAGLAEDARPALRATGNVAEDAAPEEVHLYGRTLVVVGPRYQGGRGYHSVELPASDGRDVLALDLADVTDDGRAEAIVRVRRASSAQVRGQEVTIEKEFVLAYCLDGERRGRVFAAEVARRVGADGVTNRVRLPRGRSATLVVEAGEARGWSAATYPFRDAPAQGFAPLLLPWEPASRRVTYRWNGTAVVRAP